MAVHTIDLRGDIKGQTPEETLQLDWQSDVPRTDRLGVHATSIYEFITPAATLGISSGDVLRGLFEVPSSEVWEIFSIKQSLGATSTTGVYNNVRTGYLPNVARWSVSGNSEWLADALSAALLTRPVHFSGTDEWLTHDEASESIPEAGLRKRILYPKTVIEARMNHAANVTIESWRILIDMVRYPSNAKLLSMLEANELTRDEMLAALALRFASPAEAF